MGGVMSVCCSMTGEGAGEGTVRSIGSSVRLLFARSEPFSVAGGVLVSGTLGT